MLPVIPDPRRKTFTSPAAFESGSRITTARPRSGSRSTRRRRPLPSITAAEALDVALCWGWIDGLRKGFDAQSFLQRYTPRGRNSRWSQINREHLAALVAAGRMTPHGRRLLGSLVFKRRRW